MIIFIAGSLATIILALIGWWFSFSSQWKNFGSPFVGFEKVDQAKTEIQAATENFKQELQDPINEIGQEIIEQTEVNKKSYEETQKNNETPVE